MAAKARLPKVGEKLAGFEIIRVLEEGEYSSRFEALQEKLGRKVAVKMIAPAVVQRSPDVAARFLREIELVKRLDHPNIVRMYDYGQTEDGLLWMATELVEGRSLEAELAEVGRLDGPRTKHIMLQVLSGLTEAHEQATIHRRIDPATIFLTRKGAEKDVVKLLDFGLAKAIGLSADPALQDITGSLSKAPLMPHYSAPELLKMEEVGAFSDVYACGLVMYEMLTGTPAVDGDNIIEAFDQQISRPLILPDWLSSSPFGPIISKAAQKTPSDRYRSALELHAALKEIDATALKQPKDAGERTDAAPTPKAKPSLRGAQSTSAKPAPSVADLKQRLLKGKKPAPGPTPAADKNPAPAAALELPPAADDKTIPVPATMSPTGAAPAAPPTSSRPAPPKPVAGGVGKPPARGPSGAAKGLTSGVSGVAEAADAGAVDGGAAPSASLPKDESAEPTNGKTAGPNGAARPAPPSDAKAPAGPAEAVTANVPKQTDVASAISGLPDFDAEEDNAATVIAAPPDDALAKAAAASGGDTAVNPPVKPAKPAPLPKLNLGGRLKASLKPEETKPSETEHAAPAPEGEGAASGGAEPPPTGLLALLASAGTTTSDPDAEPAAAIGEPGQAQLPSDLTAPAGAEADEGAVVVAAKDEALDISAYVSEGDDNDALDAPQKRSPVLLIAAVLLILGAGGGLAWYLTQPKDSSGTGKETATTSATEEAVPTEAVGEAPEPETAEPETPADEPAGAESLGAESLGADGTGAPAENDDGETVAAATDEPAGDGGEFDFMDEAGEAQPTEPAVEEPAAPTTVTWELGSMPEGASVSLEGRSRTQLCEATPCTVDLEVGTSEMKVRFDLAGHEKLVASLTPSKDGSLEVELEPIKTAAAKADPPVSNEPKKERRRARRRTTDENVDPFSAKSFD